jgi:hypothetical protein
VIEILAQIAGKHRTGKNFHAGIVLWDDLVIEAAPIVHYMKRGKWDRDRVRAHCLEKGWTIDVVHRMERSKT